MNPTPDAPAFLVAWDSCYQRASSAIPDGVMERVRRSWFDTLATIAGGVSESSTQAAWRACTADGSEGLHPWDVALLLGTASHALDYDDVCMLATCHPSAPPIAALLALLPILQKQHGGLRLGDILAAYLVGTETTLRLGRWLGFRHYALGFHATATLGAIGAAAACAHALKLPLAHAHAALSIAASSSGGLRANFGSDVKPLHVGFAASAAVRAALLAQAGAGASDDVWEGDGFFHAFTGGLPVVALDWVADTPWAIDLPGFEHKRFPSCYMTHRLIAGILGIRSRQPVAAVSQPVEIEIDVPRNGLAALKYPEPSTGLQGKFSGPYCAASAWIDGQVALASFTDFAVQRPDAQMQMKRVTLRERADASEDLQTAPVNVTVRGNGWSDTLAVDWAPGSTADPMQRAELQGKWRDCARHGGMHPDDALALHLLDASLDTEACALLMPLSEIMTRAIRRIKMGRPLEEP